ncbi:hypothetical protein ABK040_012044 [Willaertia magna]
MPQSSGMPPVGLPLCFVIYPNYILNNSMSCSSLNSSNNSSISGCVNSGNSCNVNKRRQSIVKCSTPTNNNNASIVNLFNTNYVFSSSGNDHISTVSYNKSTSSASFTTSTSSSSSNGDSDTSENEFMVFNGDSKYNGVQRLRENFENWLIETFGEKKGNFIFQKLLFLDEFFDPNKDKIRRIMNLEDLFQSLNRYLFKIVKKHNIFYTNEEEKFPYLLNLQQTLVLQQIEDTIDILNQHEDLQNYLIENSNLLHSILTNENNTTNNEEKNSNPTTELSLDGLRQLCVMFYLDVYNHFQLYQNTNTKYINQWIVNELSNSPGYLFDNLQKRIQKYNNYKKITKYTTNDFNTTSVIDSDFDFVKFLTKNTIDWELQKFNPSHSYQYWKCQNQHFVTIPDMNSLKIVGFLNHSLETVCKTTLQNPTILTEKNETNGHYAENGRLSNFQKILNQSSLRKYPTFLHESTLNFGTIFKKRQLHNVNSIKVNFIGKNIQEVIHFYKTCEMGETKNFKVVTIGARIFNKLDKNCTLYTDVSLTNLKGIMNTTIFNNLSNKLFVKHVFESLIHTIEEEKKKASELSKNGKVIVKQNNSNDEECLMWKCLREYCLHYYKVDVNDDWN